MTYIYVLKKKIPDWDKRYTLNKHHSHIINFRALALALLLLLAFGAKEVHHFTAHAHVETKICNDGSESDTHWHDAEYLHEDCSLCDFTFSIFDFSLPTFSLQKAQCAVEKTNFSFKNSFLTQSFFYIKGRAPPTR